MKFAVLLFLTSKSEILKDVTIFLQATFLMDDHFQRTMDMKISFLGYQ
jgi:hypothetical protein